MKNVTTVLITALLVLLMAGSAMCATPVLMEAPRNDAAPTEPVIIDGHACGFIPPAHVSLKQREAGHWETKMGTCEGAVLPSAWDWRDHGGVSAVKDQGRCGSCYAFGFAGQVESLLMIAGANETNLSENSIKEGVWRELIGYGCPNNCWGSCDGGNALACANLYSTWGSVDEPIDPYVPYDVSYDYWAPREDIFTEWHLMSSAWAPPPNDIKEVVQLQPVYTSIDADCLSGYTGGVIQSEISGTNHAVMIVGWEDYGNGSDNGYWICKNSWGAGWGDEGFFYIEYGAAGIGNWTSYSTEWHEARGDERLYYYDEGGWSQSWAWGDGDGTYSYVEMVVEYVPGPCENATSIEFWATDACDATVELYSGFNISTGTGNSLLNSHVGGLEYADAGYYSVEFEHEVPLTAGVPVYVYVYIDGPLFPMPTDGRVGPYEPLGKAWALHPDYGWQPWNTEAAGDFGVRMRTVTYQRPPCPVPEIPTLAAVGLGICMVGILARRKP